MSSSRLLNALFITSSAICLVTTASFFIMAATCLGRDVDIFSHGVYRSDAYNHPSKIRPSKWAQLTLWITVLTFQLAWLTYAFYLFYCKHCSKMRYLFEEPPYVPLSFYGLYIISLSMVTLWLFTKDNDYTSAAFVSMVASTLSLLTSIFISIRQLWLYEVLRRRTDMWMNIIISQNGLGLFATWCLVTTLLELDSVLVKDVEVSVDDSANTCLSILLAATVIYVMADFYLTKKWLRYFLAPYIVLVLTVVGILQDNWKDGETTSYLTAALLSVLTGSTLGKLAAIVYWTSANPLSMEVTWYD